MKPGALFLVGLSILGIAWSSAWESMAQAAEYSGYKVSLTIAYHQEIPLLEFDASEAKSLLAGATKLIAFRDTNSSCNPDHTACVNLVPNGVSKYNWNNDPDLDFVDEDTASDFLLSVSGSIKVAGTVQIGGEFKGGFALGQQFNSAVALWSDSDPNERALVGPAAWAHEIGHNCDLSDKVNPVCSNDIMNETLGELGRNRLDETEAQSIEVWVGIYGGAATVACDPTGAAWLEDRAAVVGQVGVEISFRTLWEVNTESFEARRIDPSSGTVLYSVGTPVPTSAGMGLRYSVTDPGGSTGSVYQIVEHQTGGRGDLYSDLVVADVPRPPDAWGSDYDPDSLAQVVVGYGQVGVASQYESCSGPQPSYLILCPDSFSVALGYYASLWNQAQVSTRVRAFSTVDSCLGSYGEYIKFAAANGTTHFLLVGDANDHLMWDDPAKWQNGWWFPASLDSFWNFPHVPSQTHLDIIPTFYTAVADSPQTSWTAFTPYYSSDLPYSDVDGDDLPDVALGRLPASTIQEVYAYTAKLATWLNNVGGNFRTSAGLFTYATTHGTAPAWPTAFGVSGLRERITPSGQLAETSVIEHAETGGVPQTDSLRAAIYRAARGYSDVIVWNWNATNRYSYEGVWMLTSCTENVPLDETARPFISVGLSCGMNNFDQQELYCGSGSDVSTWIPENPIVEKLLLNPAKGAIAQIGPTRGSQLHGNLLFGQELLGRMYEPGNTLGQAFILAQRNSMLAHPEYRDLFRSYVLLGDPRLGPIQVVTGAKAEASSDVTRLLRPQPNPFNPRTELRYYLKQPSRSSLTLFDVRGRVVRRLLQHAHRRAGWGEAVWGGETDGGAAAASGVYFAVLRAGSTTSVQRLVLLR